MLIRYGSPTLDDINAFSKEYEKRLDEAVAAGEFKEDYSLEVRKQSFSFAVITLQPTCLSSR